MVSSGRSSGLYSYPLSVLDSLSAQGILPVTKRLHGCWKDQVVQRKQEKGERRKGIDTNRRGRGGIIASDELLANANVKYIHNNSRNNHLRVNIDPLNVRVQLPAKGLRRQ